MRDIIEPTEPMVVQTKVECGSREAKIGASGILPSQKRTIIVSPSLDLFILQFDNPDMLSWSLSEDIVPFDTIPSPMQIRHVGWQYHPIWASSLQDSPWIGSLDSLCSYIVYGVRLGGLETLWLINYRIKRKHWVSSKSEVKGPEPKVFETDNFRLIEVLLDENVLSPEQLRWDEVVAEGDPYTVSDFLAFVTKLRLATCTDHAVWVSQDRTPLEQSLGRALPGLDLEKLEALNPWYSPGITVPGRIYKIPYDESMTIVPPASWAGGCPKTLVLDSRERKAEAQSSEQLEHIVARASTNAEEPAQNNIKARSIGASDNSKGTKTPSTTYSSTKAAPKTMGTANALSCWKETHPTEKFDSSQDLRLEFITTFCNRLKEVSLNPQSPLREYPYQDTLIGINLLSCPKYHFGTREVASCHEVMKYIDHKCPDSGGVYSTSCLLYYFVKRDDIVWNR
ncbi:uncharacterized protein FPOAC1_013910 [Fusarium poae]|uniref:uncharacterized protein n=1 Tax=Fusarium poae TaxID=36050 RepID=UPI001D0467BD|nr:uncharacterized protein FPOAC1_013910 [Fusarium poae]KAG8664203.1 hypothetical protein FPOAC1_013910 [Fusarium poae]